MCNPKEIKTLNDYESWFGKSEKEKAIKEVLDIRKFEIELYWKRAQYFWLFNSLALSGYATVYIKTVSDTSETGLYDILIFVSGIGLLVSFAWYLANRGSKFWQENWEIHLDLMEDSIHGPLYKSVMREITSNISFLSAGMFSVSKINILLSLYSIFLWLVLLCVAFQYKIDIVVQYWRYAFVVIIIAMGCAMFKFCKSDDKSYLKPWNVKCNLRDTKFKN